MFASFDQNCHKLSDIVAQVISVGSFLSLKCSSIVSSLKSKHNEEVKNIILAWRQYYLHLLERSREITRNISVILLTNLNWVLITLNALNSAHDVKIRIITPKLTFSACWDCYILPVWPYYYYRQEAASSHVAHRQEFSPFIALKIVSNQTSNKR